MGIEDSHYLSHGKMVTPGYRRVSGFGIFQVFEYIDFCFKGQPFTGINERIRFMEGKFALLDRKSVV